MNNKAHIDVVLKGFNTGKSDDDILRDLFKTGVKFNRLRTIFNDIVKSEGLRLSAKDRKTKTSEILKGWVPVDAQDVLAKVSSLQDELKIIDAKALSAVRIWAKENSIELPKPARKVRVIKVGFSGHYRKILDFALGHREVTRKEVHQFCEANSIPGHYSCIAMNIIHFAKEWAGESEVLQGDLAA